MNPIRVALIVGVAVIIIVIRRQRRQVQRTRHQLASNQRAVYWQRQWLDPVVELLVVGGVIWADLHHGLLPWVAVAIGIVVGVPLGIVRGRLMYVRSLSRGGKIVLERNAAELSVMAVLIIIKLAAETLSKNPDSLVNLLAVGLLAVGVASSIGRVCVITWRHFASLRDPKHRPADAKPEL